jgi:hypothetical protein
MKSVWLPTSVPGNYQPGTCILRSAQFLRSAIEEGICLDYFFSLGSTHCIRSRHDEGGVRILHC